MKIAMIGSGGFAQAHLRVLSDMPEVEVVGHVSSARERREAAVRRWGGKAYASCEELLESERLDAAWITVPPAGHGSIEQCLIERNIPFFVEKPLSAERETGESIGRAVSEARLVAGVGYHWRAMDNLHEIRSLLAHHPAHLVIAAWHGSTPPRDWWQRQATSGGQMVEQATHLFDMARHLLGEARVLSATADRHEREAYPEMDVADTSTAVIAFDSGAKGVFTATCLLQGAEEVYVKFVCEGRLLTITREGVTVEHGKERRFVRQSESPIVRENQAFIAAVREEDDSLLFCSYDDALRTHRLCFDVLEASRGQGAREAGTA
jgi:myo-inositol 2-dehydrogenase/D-chiro-inositol 1-dehydrogenase